MGSAVVVRGARYIPSNGLELRKRELIQRQAIGAQRENAVGFKQRSVSIEVLGGRYAQAGVASFRAWES